MARQKKVTVGKEKWLEKHKVATIYLSQVEQAHVAELQSHFQSKLEDSGFLGAKVPQSAVLKAGLKVLWEKEIGS